MIEALKYDAEADVRTEAAVSLGMGEGMGKKAPEVLNAVAAALRQDAEIDVRSMAAGGLALLGQGSLRGVASALLEGTRGAKHPSIPRDAQRGGS